MMSYSYCILASVEYLTLNIIIVRMYLYLLLKVIQNNVHYDTVIMYVLLFHICITNVIFDGTKY